ncbi:MAG: ribosomal protein S18-alanine N-acetyltransferase, partial [Oscillospiraceae bacterium]|nr:ribosomal protein S18-alanine N-acetyltransferase [Oscillospiraceae bacterium]
IVKMSEVHVFEIAELEKISFSTPWTEQGLEEEIENSFSRFFVAQNNGEVLGYIGAHNVLGEVYITNIAIFPEFKRQGIGKKLIETLLNSVKEENAEFVTLEVRKSNESAIGLYKKMGFKVVGERKDFYKKPKENALLMTYYLNEVSNEDIRN